MPEKDIIAPVRESDGKGPAESDAADAGAKPDAGKEETIGEVLQTNASEAEHEAKTVPLSALIELKKTDKEQKRQIRELQKRIEGGELETETATDIDALIEEFPDADPNFLKKFVKLARAEAKKEAEEEVSNKLKPIRAEQTAKQLDERFEAQYAKVLENMPEYAKIANKGVIKTLTLSPSNSNKTFTQIIEESYGHLVTGKRTVDAGSARAGKNDDAEVDFKRAAKDTGYYQEIMANPVLKKKYNARMVEGLSSKL